MAELRTEEEQIDAFKRWWKANGRSLVIGVVVAIAIVMGWRGWQQYQQNQADAASALYQNMLAAAVQNEGQPLSEENRKSADHLATQLKDEFGSSVYGHYAALWLADSAVATGDLAAAQTHLNWLLEQEPDEVTAMTAKLRLARILLAQDDAAQALSLLGDTPVVGYEASFYELTGDILLVQGDKAGARAAYNKALAAPNADQRPLLAMKYDDLAPLESSN